MYEELKEILVNELREKYQKMLMPVRCNRCQSIYDLVGTGITDRYSDCTVWITPRCGKKVNDSKVFMSTFPYKKLTQSDIENEIHSQIYN